MKGSVLIIILPTTFFFGSIFGIYIVLIYQEQLQVLGQSGILIPLFTAIGVGVTTLKFIYDWRKELALNFDEIVTKEKPYSAQGKERSNLAYCIKIKKRGVGGAEESQGDLKVKGLDTDYNPTIWYGENTRSILITMDDMDLLLFEIVEANNQRMIRFIPKLGSVRQIPYNEENLNRELVVRIGSKNAKTPKPYSKVISQIIGNTIKSENNF